MTETMAGSTLERLINGRPTIIRLGLGVLAIWKAGTDRLQTFHNRVIDVDIRLKFCEALDVVARRRRARRAHETRRWGIGEIIHKGRSLA
jgi:hypothetical protein